MAMLDPLRRLVLRVARVPAEPQPPFGAPESIRVFRAGKNHYRVSLLGWFLAQVGAVVGIFFSVNFLHHLREDLRDSQGHEEVPALVAPAEEASEEAVVQRVRRHDPTRHAARHVGRHLPSWLIPLLIIGEAVAIAAYVIQLPLTLAAVRLDYEMRWYMVTDRSLRIRTGIFKVQESTMSFANLQQVEVNQGPLQRLLGLADVRVQSAGGGGSESHGKGQTESLHTGVFQGVEHASEIRDLIQERLRRFRASGLGDPDDHPDHLHDAVAAAVPAGASSPTGDDALLAARELLEEARALRTALTNTNGLG
jgi:membrane protein YdbS with pleckstrin-like domain